jgi:hypothetical protein
LKYTNNGRHPPMDDSVQRKTGLSNGERPPMEYNFQCKTSTKRRWPHIKDNLFISYYYVNLDTQGGGTLDRPIEERVLMEDDLQCKTMFNGRFFKVVLGFRNF